MSLSTIVRKMLLCCLLGGHSVLRAGISKEEIENILYGMHKTQVEITISQQENPAPTRIEIEPASQMHPEAAKEPPTNP